MAVGDVSVTSLWDVGAALGRVSCMAVCRGTEISRETLACLQRGLQELMKTVSC